MLLAFRDLLMSVTTHKAIDGQCPSIRKGLENPQKKQDNKFCSPLCTTPQEVFGLFVGPTGEDASIPTNMERPTRPNDRYTLPWVVKVCSRISTAPQCGPWWHQKATKVQSFTTHDVVTLYGNWGLSRRPHMICTECETNEYVWIVVDG